MEKTLFHQTAFEHRFWLQILGDHARFIFNTLSPLEKDDIAKARRFMQLFDQLLTQARSQLSPAQLAELTGCACEAAADIRAFKLDLLRRHICEEVRIGLGPTFLNHMVNEVEEYLRILECLLAKEPPPLCHPLHHHLLWVLDAQGHAASITGELDLVEKELKTTSECFAENFAALYLKADEFKGYLRSGVEDFPALTRYNFQVQKEILHFSEFLDKLRDLVNSNKALGTLLPLTPDHMLREECYFLTKLAQVSAIDCPDCDPTRPRLGD